jgi:hypothetical protein
VRLPWNDADALDGVGYESGVDDVDGEGGFDDVTPVGPVGSESAQEAAFLSALQDASKMTCVHVSL